MAKSLFSVAPARENPRNPLGLQPKTQRNRAAASSPQTIKTFSRTKNLKGRLFILSVALYLTTRSCATQRSALYPIPNGNQFVSLK